MCTISYTKMPFSGKSCSPDHMIRELMSGGLCESRNVFIFLPLLMLGFFAASVNDFTTPLSSEVVSEDEVGFRPASMNCTSASIYLWDMQEMILRDVEEKGESVISTLNHRRYPCLEGLRVKADVSHIGALDRISGHISHYEADVSSDEVIYNAISEFISEIYNTSSVLESPLDNTRPPRLLPIGSVLSSSTQRAGPIFLFAHILDDAGRVHVICKYHNITRLDGSAILGDSAVYRIQAHVFGDQFVWWYRMFFSLLMLGFSLCCYLIIYHLLHFVCMVWGSLYSILFSVYTVTDDPHLGLLLRARMAYGLMRIKRMPYCELVRLRNSHAPLLDLEAARGVLSSNMLCRRMRGASLSDLSRIYDTSDIISRNVEQILLRNATYVKQQRRWEKILRDLNRECVDEQTIQMFLFILLLLSLFERADEDMRSVILYGVPGLPSVSVSVTATYAEIRSMIVQMAPKLGEFYFVARGRIIKIEDTLIDWGSGHLVLNVHTCGDLLGGSMQGSSDDERRVRKHKKRFDLQRLLLSDASDEEHSDDLGSLGFSGSESFQDNDSSCDSEKKAGASDEEHSDDLESLGFSESESFQDGDSSWDLETKEKQDRKRCDLNQRRGGDRTQHKLSVQSNRDAQRVLLSDSSGAEGSDGSISLGTSESQSFQDSDSSWDLQKRQVSLQSNRDANKRRGDDRT